MAEVSFIKQEADAVTIRITGSIRIENAKRIEEELFKVRKEHPEGKLILDFSTLHYISSSGLRVLLNIAKQEKEKAVVSGLSLDLMEIFDQTGFSRMFEIQRKRNEYHIADMQLLGTGANGAVYRLDKERVIKVFAKDVPEKDIRRERLIAQNALISGIPTAISYDVVEVDGQKGIIFELLNSNSLSYEMKTYPEKYDDLVEKYIALYKKIHQTEADPDNFRNIKDVYHEGLDFCKDWYTEEEMALLNELLESVPDRTTLIHGDYHPNNIMTQDGELIMIDMGDMSMGHPVFDFLSTAATQLNLPKIYPEYAAVHTGMPVEMIQKTWRRLFDSYFADRSETDRTRIEDQVALFSKFKVAMAPYYARSATEEVIKASVDDAKQNLFPRIREIIGTIDW